MKKSKLIASLCTLVLTLACLTFGVYSAVKTSFTASGTITFNAYGINLDIDMSFAGTETAIGNKYVSTHKDRSEHLTSGQTYTDISTGVTGLDLAFDELTVPEGKTEPELKITMTLNVKNYSGFEIMATPTLKFGASGAETTETFDSIFTSTVTNNVFNLADKATAAITIEISPKGTTAITSNNNFKFEFDFAPHNEEAFYTNNGYTVAKASDFTYSSDYKTITKYNGTAKKLYIPKIINTVNGQEVVANTFYGPLLEGDTCDPVFVGTFEEIIIGDGITTLSSGAFMNVVAKKIELSETLTNVGLYNFWWASVDVIKLPNSIKTLQNVFNSATIKNLTIPSSITEITVGYFDNCIIETLTIPVEVIKFGSYAFSNINSISSIIYTGTLSQWNGIEEESDYKDSFIKCTVHCTDGDTTL